MRRDIAYVNTAIWRDATFRSLSIPAQLVFLYLLTSPHATSPGVVQAYDVTMARDVGMQLRRFRRLVAQLEDAGMVECDWAASVVSVLGMGRYGKGRVA